MLLYLGNAAPHEVHHADTAPDDATEKFGSVGDLVRRERADLGESVTKVTTGADDPLTALAEIRLMWDYHSSEPPAWVGGDDDDVVNLLARQYGCKTRTLDKAEAAYEKGAGK